ncbi:hypothetical protein AMATHDRAFT_74215 [Amanita thiersii Skay4041]|uniref:DUF6593 domain-containing protein n=1 Tax=Amanita thiersii Skay4041 TaxID=703135 RepID=A0A2A9NSV2_9AGAR|nr:hypothetical protein AMATHDRAFT_74215 [Amanita thiersii Skay4041]
MTMTTYDLFFTGRNDPRSCVIIGEDTKPIYFCFETPTERAATPINTSTLIYRNQKDICAKLEWSHNNSLGNVIIGNRRVPMTHLLMSGSVANARSFLSVDGSYYEWRRNTDDPMSYDLYTAQNMRIAVFRRYARQTVVGPSHGLFQYTFNHDNLLLESLLALCLNRWIDVHGV